MAAKNNGGAAKKNAKKVQPKGRSRRKPGTTGQGRFYRIEIRPKGEFKTFRIQDVGKKGDLERLAGKRASGSWDTVTWLIEKDVAHIDRTGKLVFDDAKVKESLEKQIRGRIVHVKGDIFKAMPRQ